MTSRFVAAFCIASAVAGLACCSENVMAINSNLCSLSGHNVSLMRVPAAAAPYRMDSGDMVFFWSLCTNFSLAQMDSAASVCTDKSATICIAKKSASKLETFIPNAGRLSNPLKLESESHASLLLNGGQSCYEKGKYVGYSTRFDFFCDENEELSAPSIHFQGLLGNCTFQFFWQTPHVCSREQEPARESTDFCLVRSASGSALFDLEALKTSDGYDVRSADGQRRFELNLCGPVSAKSACQPPGSFLCEVARDSQASKAVIGPNPELSTFYNETFGDIVLHYVGSNGTATFHVQCDKEAVNPKIEFVRSESSIVNTFEFSIKTASVCFGTKFSCNVEDSGQKYDLSGLMTNQLEWTAYDNRQGFSDKIYHLSVCQTLSSSKCPGSGSAVCQSSTSTQEYFSLGVVTAESKISVGPKDHALTVVYENGGVCNAKHNYSTEIVFHCDLVESGPVFVGMTEECRHLFEWRSPYACPVSDASGPGCAVKDEAFGNVFDFTSLYNRTADYKVAAANGERFRINVCGDGLVKKCGSETSKVSVCRISDSKEYPVALEMTRSLAHNGGQMTLDFTTKEKCDANPTKNVTTKFIFICDHSAIKTSPEFVNAGPCENYFIWKTAEACPPYAEVQCSVEDDKGNVYDLTRLSLPSNNYVIRSREGSSTFTLNLCRSIVHNSASSCPYRTAVCLSEDGSSNSAFTSLGEVGEGPRFVDGQLVLHYPMGALCTDQSTPELHLSTRVLFKCKHNVIESSPEFVEKVGCTYHFVWENAAACPRSVTNGPASSNATGNCTISHPETGHVYDLGSLRSAAPNSNLEAKMNDNSLLEVNICSAVSGHASDDCSSSGACLTSADGRKASLGTWNADLVWLNDNVVALNYSDGSPCLGNDSLVRRNTLIRLQCFEAHSPNQIIPSFMGECTTVLDLYTPLTCQHTVYCGVEENGKHFDLSPLMNFEKNYEISVGQLPTYNYIINVCKSLVRTPGLKECLPEYSAVCKARGLADDSYRNTSSLGYAMTPPFINEYNELVVRYQHGTECPGEKKGSDSEIRFICAPGIYPGHPELSDNFDLDSCHQTFIWRTALACANSTRPASYDPKGCLVYHSFLEGFVSLKSLRNDSADLVTDNDHGDQYSLQACGKAGPCDGSVCKGSRSLGYLRMAYYDLDEDVLHVRYRGNEVCRNTASAVVNYSAEIRFMCDHQAGQGKPTFFTELPCLTIFEWRTVDVCDVVRPNEREEISTTSDWAIFFAVIICSFVVFSGVWLWKRENREKAARSLAWLRTKVTPRRRDDSNLLINDLHVPTFGEMGDNDDDLILA